MEILGEGESNEWWTSGSGTLKCAEAGGVSVSDSNVPHVDFSLDAKKGVSSLFLLLGD
jgi:hypothetical protein